MYNVLNYLVFFVLSIFLGLGKPTHEFGHDCVARW